MDVFIEKLKKFNGDWNDLPRRALMIIATCVSLFIAVGLFRYLAPFICAVVFALIITPLARPLEKLLSKIHLPKKIGSFIAVLLVFGALLALLVLIIAALTGEAASLMDNLPQFVDEVAQYITKAVERGTDMIQDQVGDEALKSVYEVLMSGLNRLAEIASGFAASLVSFTWTAVTTLPEAALFVIFTIMESYYVVADRDTIMRFFKRWAPGKLSAGYGKVKNVMLLGIRVQVVTAILQMFIACAVLLIGFSIIGMRYSLMFAILISVLDALPVIGAGLIMFPMAGYYLLTGDYMMALGVMVIYFVVIVVKRIMEPKLIGRQMRMNQLATMVSMYAGFAIMGFIGLIVGPLLLMLFTVILGGNPGGEQTDEIPKKHRRKK